MRSSNLRTIAYPLLAAPFIAGGAQSLVEPGPLPEFAGRLGVPLPAMATRVTAAAMVAGGLALASGVAPRGAALLLAGCLSGASIGVHRFWEAEDPQERFDHRNAFMRNIGLLGGLALAAHTASP
jgi:uncharacterized membrane protein YphA (DoxX/SURF4 family)